MKGRGKRKKSRLALVLAVTMAASVWSVPVMAAEGSNAANEMLALSETKADEGIKADEKDAKIVKAEAEKLLRQYVRIPDDYQLQSSSYRTGKLVNGTRSYWEMYFVKRVNGKQTAAVRGSLDAASGQLLSFYNEQYAPVAQTTYPLKVDRTSALKLAEEFINQIAKPYSSDVGLNETYGVMPLPPLSGSVTHQIRFDRIVEGIPYLGNYIELSINSEGHVESFGLNWDETIVFPKAGNYMSKEQAVSALNAAASLELRYVLPYNAPSDQRIPRLSYGMQTVAVDAVTGQKTNDDRSYIYYYYGDVSKTPLTSEPLAAKPQPTSISEKDAIAAVEKAFPLPEGSELQSSGYTESREEGESKTSSSWNLDWSVKREGSDPGSISARVNGSTGAIESYYNFRSRDTSESKGITLEQAIAKAEEIVKQQLPWLSHELYTIAPSSKIYEGRKPEEIYSYDIQFQRKVNGAIIDYDSVYVSVDAISGQVRSYSSSIHSFDYPAKSPALITRSEALAKWMDYYDVQLTYRVDQQYMLDGALLSADKVDLMRAAGDPAFARAELKADIGLIYQLADKDRPESLFLDAQSGEWRSQSTGAVTGLELPRATDAEGHWAEEALQLMVAYRALELNDGKVTPSAVITRGELIKMLVLARNNGRALNFDMIKNSAAAASFADVAADSTYFAYVETALQQNLIDLGDGAFNPDEPVTRDDMSELIVRALGYNTLANYDYIFKVSFKDEAAIVNKGQAAITVGLKIMSLSDGKFLPVKKVTRAEAATAFFRYLQKREELQEAPLRM
ncbi:YcdB/YcdC domain-containing protein [Paenibacillus sp. CAU 1782]